MVDESLTDLLPYAAGGLVAAEATGLIDLVGGDSSNGQQTNDSVLGSAVGSASQQAVARAAARGAGNVVAETQAETQSAISGLTDRITGSTDRKGRDITITRNPDPSNPSLPQNNRGLDPTDDRTNGDPSNRSSEYGGDPLGFNYNRVTETAEDETQGLIGAASERLGDIAEGAAAGGAVGGAAGLATPIPGDALITTPAGALVGGAAGAVGVDVGDAAGSAVEDLNPLSGGNDNSRSGQGSSSSTDSVDVPDSGGSVDTDGDGSADASFSPRASIPDTSAPSGGSSTPSAGRSQDSTPSGSSSNMTKNKNKQKQENKQTGGSGGLFDDAAGAVDDAVDAGSDIADDAAGAVDDAIGGLF